MSEESKFQFLGYRVSEIHCEIQDSFDPQESKLSQSIEIQQSYDKDRDRFVEIMMDVSLESKDKSFKFFIRTKGGFIGNEGMPQELFEKFSSQNAPAIMYPFIRAIIATYTAQANIPPIILPAINFAARQSTDKKAE
jgi:preprotein translocase subunit SecB